MTKRPFARLAAAALALASASHAFAQPVTITEAQSPAYRRAVEAAIWGVPLVSVDAMREAYFRDAGAHYNDIVYWSTRSDWTNQLTTPNNTSHYAYFNFNLKDGPVVVEIPATRNAGVYGNLENAWQVPRVDFGPKGVDKGDGGKFLLLPPGYAGEVAAGYVPLRMDTVNGYILFRANPRSDKPADLKAANALLHQLRAYPLAAAAAPPPQRFIDMKGKLFDGIVRFDDSFYTRLARMIAEEPANPRDLAMLGSLRTLGIGRSLTFAPDPEMRALLKRAATQAHDEIVDRSVQRRTPFWPGARWSVATGFGEIARAGLTFQTADALLTDERASAYFLAFALPAKLGEASFYLSQFEGDDGGRLQGERDHVLRVPANVPAKDFWSVTVYDLATAGFVAKSPIVGLDSNNPALQRNADGSVDIYFGPRPPTGKRANWIYTQPGREWFATFRFYGPMPALFDKSWSMKSVTPR